MAVNDEMKSNIITFNTMAKILREIADDDWWVNDYENGPLYCLFCHASTDQRGWSHEPGCIWVRSIAVRDKLDALDSGTPLTTHDPRDADDARRDGGD